MNTTNQFPLFNDDYSINSNKDLKYLIPIGIVVFAVMLLFTFIIGWHENVVFFFGFLVLIASKYLLKKIIAPRQIEKQKMGTIQLTEKSIELVTDTKKTIAIEDISELVYFLSYEVNDLKGRLSFNENGDALIFVKTTNNESFHFKFNIPNKKTCLPFTELIKQYNNSVPYIKRYSIDDVELILNPEMSERVQFN